MKKNLLIIYCILIAISDLGAQTIDFEHFSTIKSSGSLPDDFTVLPSVKFNEDVSTIVSDSKTEQQDKETFLLESNYMLENMLNSGRVIFGDPVTIYLNKIKDEILKDDVSLRDNIRVYTLLSNDVNAFTFDNGIVLVTTGLISQAQNEAQLAFVLCHEFIHYRNKHAITGYVESRKIERGSGVYASLNREEEDIFKFSYAKEQETEADEEGLELYKKTKYAYDVIEGVFDVLLYSYLPIDEIEFSHTYFNDEGYVVPETYFLDTLNAITAEENYDDEKSTHPNISKRKKSLIARVPENSDAGRKHFIQDSTSFYYVQKICRYQGCEMYLFDIEYENALYEAYILSQEDSSQYLKNVIAQSLYGLTMYKNAGSTPDWRPYYKNVEGQSQQVYYLMHKMSAKEVNILALKYAWEAHLADPANTQMKKICEQLGYGLRNDHSLMANDFLTAAQAEKLLKPQTAKTDSSATDSVAVTPAKVSKYDKIKSEKTTAVTTTAGVHQYWEFAFTDFISDPDFKALFKEKDEEATTSGNKKKSKKAKEEYHLGVDDIVVVDPVVVNVNERNKNPVQYVAAEQSRIQLEDIVNESGDKLNLEVEYIDHNKMNSSDVEKFNDMAVLNRWIHEKLDHMDEDVYMLTSTTDEMQELAKKYGSNYFTWIGIASFTEKERNVGAKIALCIYLPLAPFLIYDLVTPDRNTFYFALVANAETGKFEMTWFNSNKTQASTGAMESNIYYILQQIKSSK